MERVDPNALNCGTGLGSALGSSRSTLSDGGIGRSDAERADRDEESPVVSVMGGRGRPDRRSVWNDQNAVGPAVRPYLICQKTQTVRRVSAAGCSGRMRAAPKGLARLGGLGLRAGVARGLRGPRVFLLHRRLDGLLLRLRGREEILDFTLCGRLSTCARGERVSRRGLVQLPLGFEPDFCVVAGGASPLLPELLGFLSDFVVSGCGHNEGI